MHLHKIREKAEGDVLHLHKIREKLNAMLKREGKQDVAQRCFEVVGVLSPLELLGTTPEEIFSH